jgi:hypothetical protein
MSELTFMEVELEDLIMLTMYIKLFWDVTPSILEEPEAAIIRFL